MTHGKTYNKLPCRINHKATKSKINTGTTALEWSVEQTTGCVCVCVCVGGGGGGRGVEVNGVIFKYDFSTFFLYKCKEPIQMHGEAILTLP